MLVIQIVMIHNGAIIRFEFDLILDDEIAVDFLDLGFDQKSVIPKKWRQPNEGPAIFPEFLSDRRAITTDRQDHRIN